MRPSPILSRVAHGLAAAATALALVLAAPVAASAAPLTAPLQTSDAAGTVEWTVSPATAGAADDRLSLRHVADPGAVITDEIIVTNTGQTAAEFTVSAGDGRVGSDGAFDIATGTPEDSGAWITIGGLQGGAVHLEPGTSTALPVTITVPADALPGDHPAGIVVGLRQDGQGVTVTHRIGVRMHLQVAGELTPALAVSAAGVSFTPSLIPFAPGTATVDYTVENTGNVRLGAHIASALTGPFGLGAAETAAEQPTELLPGTSAAGSATVEVSPWGWLTGTVTVTPTSIGEDAVALPAVVTAEFSGLAISWTTLAAIALVVLVLIALIARAVRRRRRAALAEAAEASEPEKVLASV